MNHYICHGCQHTSTIADICDTEACIHQWELMTSCQCTDGLHGKIDNTPVTKDSNGTILHNGDSVVLIKDLTLRGTSQKIKQGTKVSSIRLTETIGEIDCKINGTAIVLKTEFLKKI